MESRRVLHVCDFFMMYASSLAGAMAGHGHEVALLSRDHDLEFGGEAGAMRRYVSARGEALADHYVVPGRMRDGSALPEVRRTRRCVKAFAPEVVHFQESVGTDVRLLAASGIPWGRLALTVHDPSPHPGESWTLARRLVRRALVRGAGVIFVHSEVLKDALIAEERPAAPIVVIPHGVDAPDPQAFPDRPSLLFFGRIATFYKGLDVLLDAMPRVWSRRPETTLTIAGSGELGHHPTLDDPRVSVINRHIADAEVPGLFRAATCCVLPYREASQSGVGSLAKSFGRPIVATNVGGLPELVGPDGGLVVAAGDVDALADGLLEVVDDRGRAERMGRAAIASTAAASWARVAQATIQAYDEHILSRP